jgi:hypothetical protein
MLRRCTSYRAFLGENSANGGADNKGGENDIIHRCEVTRHTHRTTKWQKHLRMYSGKCGVGENAT